MSGRVGLRRSFKFLLRPTAHQEQALAVCLDDHRHLYNAALEHRRIAYGKARVSVSYFDQTADLKHIREDDPSGQGRWSYCSQQATLRRLDRAYSAFFRRVKAGEKPGFPRFKGVGRFDSVEWPKNGDGCRWDSTPHDPVTRVRLQGIGHVRVHQHRSVKGRVKTITVKREGSRWYVVVSCDDVPAETLPATGAVTGIDVGIAHFLTTTEGVHVPNPRCGKQNADALADAQRALAEFPRNRRRDQRTAKHKRAVEKVAKLHRKIARQRLDHAHKTALALVRDYDVIAHEALNIAGMTRAPRPKPDTERPGAFLPNGAAAKAWLNKSILDAGWGMFLRVLRDKAESAGRVLIPVNPTNTSRTCPPCGHCAAENRDKEKFLCVRCGHADHADRVGAHNVAVRAGLVLPQAA